MNVEELRYKITGSAMAVHRHFGPGYLEEVYKNALMIELKELGLECEKEVPIPVEYKGVRVGDYRADIIVEKRMILELKARLPCALRMRHSLSIILRRRE